MPRRPPKSSQRQFQFFGDYSTATLPNSDREPQPEEKSDAVQDDSPRTPAAAADAPRTTPPAARASIGSRGTGSGTEIPARALEGSANTVPTAAGSDGNQQRGPRTGGGGNATTFVERAGDGFGRFDGSYRERPFSPSFAARIKPARPQRQFQFSDTLPPASVKSGPVEELTGDQFQPEVPHVSDQSATPDQSLAVSSSVDHSPHLSQITVASGGKAKARDLLAAIRTLKVVEAEHRPATAEEQVILARFSGFGAVALSIFPDPLTGHYKDPSWRVLGEELRSLLSDDEYDSAKRTTFNAFYTSPIVISAMHGALHRLGIPRGSTVLEPGCGIGNFMSHDVAGHHFIGIELDGISGRIARLLHPQQDIRIENFRDTKLADSSIEAVIGNVPFADVKLDYRGEKLSLHDFCFAKSLNALQPGGVVALVTSHFTLDKQNAAVRELLASKADFLGAIRLPSNAFQREGTSVVTDIVFLRKRAPGQTPHHADPAWLHVMPKMIDGVAIPINCYFHAHPEMVLGTWSREDRLYGGEGGYSLAANGELAQQLKAAVERLPELPQLQPREPRSTTGQQFTPPPLLKHISEGSFHVGDDRTLRQVVDGHSESVTYGGSLLKSDGSLTGRRIGALIGLRDRARLVLQSQNEGWPESYRDDARKELNRAYDQFLYSFGPINKTTFGETANGTVLRRMPNLVKFREDPDAMLVMSLEDYDEVTGQATKAAIMQKDVVGKQPPVTSVTSAEEGLLVSLDQRGHVDLPFIAQLYGRSEDQVIDELGDLIYEDPQSQSWETSDIYLSGNVRAKLAQARAAGARFARNVTALGAVQPEDILPGDIDANLGSPWIPVSDIEDFAADLFKVASGTIRVGHLKKDAVWSVDAGYMAERSVAATADYGTERVNGVDLFEQALNMKTPTVYDTVYAGDREERVVNQEETMAAREKQKRIKERFREWLFADPDRTERLVRLYNDTYNNIRLRQFDGSHLAFPAMNKTVALRPHQTAAVWRGMSSGNTLLAHVVGAGKSFTMAATGMKMKQAGLIRKPMYVVPNHLLEQFAREFMQLYPNAHLLVATKDDMTRENRKRLTAKIASGEWDGIIVTHSSFERIGMSRDFQARFLREQIAEYDQLLRESAAGDSNRPRRNLIKTIEKQKARREERLKELLAEEKKDDGLVFDELGVDHLFVDEAHYFKNLETPTKMERVAGIQTGGSERAFDLFMKSRYLHELHPGHGLTFATGTPISNTMVEMYTMQRFLDLEGLLERGIEHFDAWAANFGEVVEAMEISPDGASLRPRSRFAKFINLPELQQMFRSFSDVQTAEMLHLPTPRLAGGKAHVVACPLSDKQRQLQQELVERYERIRSQKIDPRQDNALAITTDGRKLALDARMLSPEAADFPDSKINCLVENVHRIWEQSAPKRGTQMIFCDMGIQRTSWNYSAYDDVVNKLVVAGIPPSQIAAIGDADSDAKKQALFDKVRNGTVRVLIGSTQKMGTGTNVQKRLMALHHLDAPWKPAEVEQRDGRILRQGNENEEVEIYRYVTEGSFDAYMWQALETKARFISQVMAGNNTLRRTEDIGGQELSFAEVKAIASGNPAVLTLAETDAEIQRLNILKKNHADNQFVARRKVQSLPETIARFATDVSQLTSDLETLAANASTPTVIAGRDCRPDELMTELTEQLDQLPATPSVETRVSIGTFHGLKFGLVLHPRGAPEVILSGTTTRQETLSRDRPGARAVLNALERLASSYGSRRDRAQVELVLAQQQLQDYHTRLGRRYPFDAYLTELTILRDQLRLSLSGQRPDDVSHDRPSAREITAQIEALRAANLSESKPDVPDKSRTTVEIPVTARILSARLRDEVTLKVPVSAVRTEATDGGDDFTEKQPHRERLSARRRSELIETGVG